MMRNEATSQQKANMGHSIDWDNNDKTVVLQQYHAPATKEDLYQLAQKSSEMLNAVPHTVHLILDERSIKLLLTTIDLQYLEKFVPRNQGICVMVVPKFDVSYKMLTQRLGKFVAPKSVNRSYFASSVEEARELLCKKASVLYP
jgi:hypothetical protein